MNFHDLTWISFKSIFSDLPEKEQKAIEGFLSFKEKSDLQSIPKVSLDALTSNIHFDFLDHIHSDWLIFLFEKLPYKDKKIIAHVFSKQKNALLEAFLLQTEEIELNPLVISYIKNLTYKKLLDLKESTAPIFTIQDELFFDLLFLPSEKLSSIILGLGFFDLKKELNTIIDKDKIQLIKTQFNETHLLFLKELLKEQDPVSLTPMGLNAWSGNFDELKKMVYHRGMNRLAKITFGQSTTFNWHLNLILSIEEAKLLKKLSIKTLDKQILHLLQDQLQKTYSFFSEEGD
jgi:hypothetical protein